MNAFFLCYLESDLQSLDNDHIYAVSIFFIKRAQVFVLFCSRSLSDNSSELFYSLGTGSFLSYFCIVNESSCLCIQRE